MGMNCVSPLSFSVFGLRIVLLLLLRVANWISQQEAVAAETSSIASWKSSSADHSAPSMDQQQHRKLMMMDDHADQYRHHHLHLHHQLQGEQHKLMRSRRWYGNSSSSSNSSSGNGSGSNGSGSNGSSSSGSNSSSSGSNSCIFDSTATSFTYLHVGYVYYFNISTSTLFFQAAIHECLDTCNMDCTCSAVVYDRDTENCYEFHQYIPVQTLPFNPVGKGETLSAYIKVQRGTSSNALSLHSMATTTVILSMVSAAALVLWTLPCLSI